MTQEQQALLKQMRDRISSVTLKIIIEMFEKTDEMPADQDVVLLRGLLMDELEKRDPQAFEKWMECSEPKLVSTPSHFFQGA